MKGDSPPKSKPILRKNVDFRLDFIQFSNFSNEFLIFVLCWIFWWKRIQGSAIYRLTLLYSNFFDRALFCLQRAYTAPQKHESTLLHTYVLDGFLTVDRSCTTNYFWKISLKVGSSHLYASFGTFWVQIGQLVEAQWDFKLSEEFEIDVIFLRKQRFYRFHTFFKDSLCLE